MLKQKKALAQWVLAGATLLLSQWALSEDSKGTLTLAVENDLFGGGTDKHYTHGTELSYASDTYQSDLAIKFASLMPFYQPNDETRFIFSLGQQMFTPADTQTKAPIPDDRPYAGWLYGSLGLLTDHRADSHYLDKLDLIVGYVGPGSGAAGAQRRVHLLIGSKVAQGWDNQLHHEITADVQYQRDWSVPLIANNVDLVPHAGFMLGSSQRNLSTGVTLRVGSGIDSDFGPPLIRPSAVGAQYFTPSQRVYWYFFAGGSGRYVEHNIFLDGNTDHDSLSVKKNSWVGDLQAGAVIGGGNWRLTLTEIWRSKEFETQVDGDEFGSIDISYRF